MWIIPIISGILGRLDGWGKGDAFLPILPFTMPNWKIGGINYARYAIGPLIALFTANYWYILTYSIAVSVPYGEKSYMAKYFGPYRWFIVGSVFGIASLHAGNGLWCGLLMVAMKFLNIDQSILEFLFYSFGTIIHIWR